MPSSDPLLAYMAMPLGDRRAVERLLSPAKRRALHEQIRSRLASERREKERARNPAAQLKCGLPLAKHLLAVAATAPGTEATEKTRAAIRHLIEVGAS